MDKDKQLEWFRKITIGMEHLRDHAALLTTMMEKTMQSVVRLDAELADIKKRLDDQDEAI